MNSNHIAALARETWTASGPRTPERLAQLVRLYAESYFGRPITWSAPTLAEMRDAHCKAMIAQGFTPTTSDTKGD